MKNQSLKTNQKKKRKSQGMMRGKERKTHDEGQSIHCRQSYLKESAWGQVSRKNIIKKL